MTYLPETVEVNSKGHLVMAGVDLVELARRYGTPLYVYHEELIRHNCRRYRKRLQQVYPDSVVAYAGKAFLTLAMCRLLQQEGLSLDVVSGGELYLARQAGFPLARVYFHGNNKSPAELQDAVEAGVGRVVVDNLDELRMLAEEAGKQRRKVGILLRVRPGVTGHTHDYIRTGQEDSKFGLGIAGGEAVAAAELAIKLPHLLLKGLHCHIGSQILEPQPFAEAAKVMMSVMEEIRRRTGVVLPELNLGGGLGIRYTRDDRPCDTEVFLRVVAETLRETAAALDYPPPRLILEPGRSIVGEAGLTLYTVGAVKEIPGVRRYVAVDGGMSDNLRPSLYGARYEAALANRAAEEADETVTIAGKACESGDILIRDIRLPSPRRGDILAVFSTGAYHFSMFSHYNRHLRPAVVFLRGGRSALVVERESYSDIIRLERIPDHLEPASAETAAADSPD